MLTRKFWILFGLIALVQSQNSFMSMFSPEWNQLFNPFSYYEWGYETSTPYIQNTVIQTEPSQPAITTSDYRTSTPQPQSPVVNIQPTRTTSVAPALPPKTQVTTIKTQPPQISTTRTVARTPTAQPPKKTQTSTTPTLVRTTLTRIQNPPPITRPSTPVATGYVPIERLCPAPTSSNLKKQLSTRSQRIRNPPPGASIVPNFLKRWQSKGNINTSYYESYYYSAYGQPIVFETNVTVTRINASIPESTELEGTPSHTPFYGAVQDPSTFQNWEGLSEAIFRQINLARTNPQQYAKFCEQSLQQFIDNRIYIEDGRRMMSKQGPRAWQQAISFLRQQPPVKALRRVKCLDCSARFFVSDSNKYSLFGHVDSNQRSPFQRMGISCLIKAGGQNISYGTRSARSIVLALIIDDGVPDRGHRTNMYGDFSQVGVATGRYGPPYYLISVHNFLQ